MAKDVALVIGVRKSGQLTPLDGAIADAHDFADWAGSPVRSYDVRLVTDEAGPVTVGRLKAEINEILEEDLGRLLIFYSGHGICNQIGDYWLLTDYHTDSNEAVNVAQSMRNARRLGIAQIAVFSDACRSSMNRAAMVSGSVIFPSPRGGRVISPYDEFLSTDIGDVAQEIAGEDPAKSYGVFSQCLLTALNGFEPDAAETRGSKRVISSPALAGWLESEVPLQSGKIAGGTVQYPSITPSWRKPDDEYAELLGSTVPQGGQDAPISRRALSWTAEKSGLGVSELRARRARSRARVADGEAAQQRMIEARAQVFNASRGRESFETRQGLTVIGTAITDIAVPPGIKAELFEEGGNWHVRCYSGSHTVAICTGHGIWAAATTLPRFIATLVISEDGVDSLNYAPPVHEYGRDENLRSEQILAEWSALLSVKRHLNSDQLKSFADESRQVKHINPAFGVLAAYAYERASRIDQVASVAQFFAERNRFVPFDIVALLQAYGEPEQLILEQGWMPDFEVAGNLPMLTRGWSLLDGSGLMSPDTLRLQSGLMNSVWTAFEPKTGARFAKMLKQGEL